MNCLTGQQQPVQQQQFPGPYSYTFPPGYSVQGYAHHHQQGGAAKAGGGGAALTQIYPAPGGYYIAGSGGLSLPPVTSGSAVNKGGGSSSAGGGGGSPGQSYIYGPYGSYPYAPGRVIGPIIAIGKWERI